MLSLLVLWYSCFISLLGSFLGWCYSYVFPLLLYSSSCHCLFFSYALYLSRYWISLILILTSLILYLSQDLSLFISSKSESSISLSLGPIPVLSLDPKSLSLYTYLATLSLNLYVSLSRFVSLLIYSCSGSLSLTV